MLLSNYILNTGVKPYLEYAWVCAPNAGAQSISINTPTTLTIDTEVADTGNNGSISGNQITLVSGTYQFEASLTAYFNPNYNTIDGPIFQLYNTSTSSFITRQRYYANYSQWPGSIYFLNGQFTINNSSVLELRVLTAGGGTIGIINGLTYSASFNNQQDQRTTIKLWKLA